VDRRWPAHHIGVEKWDQGKRSNQIKAQVPSQVATATDRERRGRVIFIQNCHLKFRAQFQPDRCGNSKLPYMIYIHEKRVGVSR